jgi:hypothetical protein
MLARNYRPGYSAKDGRLDGKSAWCPAPAEPSSATPYSNAWLRIDLGVAHFICKIAVQGNPRADEWVTLYRVMFYTHLLTWDSQYVSASTSAPRCNMFYETKQRNDNYPLIVIGSIFQIFMKTRSNALIRNKIPLGGL